MTCTLVGLTLVPFLVWLTLELRAARRTLARLDDRALSMGGRLARIHTALERGPEPRRLPLYDQDDAVAVVARLRTDQESAD